MAVAVWFATTSTLARPAPRRARLLAHHGVRAGARDERCATGSAARHVVDRDIAPRVVVHHDPAVGGLRIERNRDRGIGPGLGDRCIEPGVARRRGVVDRTDRDAARIAREDRGVARHGRVGRREHDRRIVNGRSVDGRVAREDERAPIGDRDPRPARAAAVPEQLDAGDDRSTGDGEPENADDQRAPPGRRCARPRSPRRPARSPRDRRAPARTRGRRSRSRAAASRRRSPASPAATSAVTTPGVFAATNARRIREVRSELVGRIAEPAGRRDRAQLAGHVARTRRPLVRLERHQPIDHAGQIGSDRRTLLDRRHARARRDLRHHLRRASRCTATSRSRAGTASRRASTGRSSRSRRRRGPARGSCTRACRAARRSWSRASPRSRAGRRRNRRAAAGRPARRARSPA